MQQEVTPDIVIEGLGAFDELVKLGAGTFGTTFKAVRGDDEYALKVLHAPANDHAHLWDREIAALRCTEHPNIVGFRSSGFFDAGGRTYPYLECEFIDGGTIADVIRSGRVIETPDDLRGLLAGLLSGLREIHDLGIIHRDIKPANVALRDGDWSAPVLLDFGLARVLDMSAHTSYPAHLGTFQYMAPEQLRGQAARTRSDLFAAGVVAYEAGVGRHPFIDGTATLQSLYDQIERGPLYDPFAINPSAWTDGIRNIVYKLLSFRGHERMSISRAMRALEEDAQ